MSPEQYLHRLGVRITPGGEVDNSEAMHALRRFREAVEAVRDAWEAVPEGIREQFTATVTFGVAPDAR